MPSKINLESKERVFVNTEDRDTAPPQTALVVGTEHSPSGKLLRA